MNGGVEQMLEGDSPDAIIDRLLLSQKHDERLARLKRDLPGAPPDQIQRVYMAKVVVMVESVSEPLRNGGRVVEQNLYELAYAHTLRELSPDKAT